MNSATTHRTSQDIFNKLPPQDLDAERGALGSGLIFGSSIDDMADLINPESFYLDAHGKIYSAMQAVHLRGEAVDAITVSNELAKRGELLEIGGDEYLLKVLGSVPHAAHARYYAGIVREKFTSRQVIYASTEILRHAYDDALPAAELLAQFAGAANELLERQVTRQAGGLQRTMVELMEQLEADEQPGLPTGFTDVDRRTNGLKPGNLIILAARPSTGKTSFAANLAWNVAGDQVAIFISLEQTARELGERWVASRLGASVQSLRDLMRDDDQRSNLLEAMNSVGDRSIVVEDQPGRTVADIAALCRIHQRKRPIGIVIIDYLQLIRSEDRKAPREVQVAGISRDLKELAKSLGVPVLALAQLNRAIENRDDKRPRLADLRESGSIEQDADLVLFLERKSTWDREANPSDANLIIAKHRNGQCCDIPLYWEANSMTFKNAERRNSDSFAEAFEGSEYFE